MPISCASAYGYSRRLAVDLLRMLPTDGDLSKPDAGNPHVRFEEGGGGSVPTPPLLDCSLW
jgi:hypothetical protein